MNKLNPGDLIVLMCKKSTHWVLMSRYDVKSREYTGHFDVKFEQDDIGLLLWDENNLYVVLVRGEFAIAPLFYFEKLET